MTEEWKDIPGYEGLYQASTLGSIRTCEGKVTSSARYHHRVWKQRIIKQKCTTNQKGRKECRVELWKDGAHKTFLVSRLVAITWVEGYMDGLTVNHKNGDHLDNRAENLEWLSRGDNIRHGFANGLFDSSCIKCKLIDKNGSPIFFNSMNQCCRYLQRSDGYLRNRLFRNQLDKPVFSKDGTQYSVFLI